MKVKEQKLINEKIQEQELQPLLERIEQLEQHNEFIQ